MMISWAPGAGRRGACGSALRVLTYKAGMVDHHHESAIRSGDDHRDMSETSAVLTNLGKLVLPVPRLWGLGHGRKDSEAGAKHDSLLNCCFIK